MHLRASTNAKEKGMSGLAKEQYTTDKTVVPTCMRQPQQELVAAFNYCALLRGSSPEKQTDCSAKSSDVVLPCMHAKVLKKSTGAVSTVFHFE